ncbi:MAG: precorrin-8X methylmutase [Pseudomonadota bacterium]|nr:precorrin-8X methylmutase [Pseudomonadota bacterium]MEC8087365.1 precorrin-8X methylmutase [Pseudomonadota bacterium]
MDWLHNPDEIYRRSFAIVRDEADLSIVPDDMTDIAIRLVHACGMPEIIPDLRWSDGAAQAARDAISSGAPVLCDVQMVAEGIMAACLPTKHQIYSMIRLPSVAAIAEEKSTTRSAAQVELWKPLLKGSVVAIGNAPTALFRLLEVIAEEPAQKPAIILGFPVGFVGAAESKDALHEIDHGVPYLTLLGRRGGSAMASAAVNAFAKKYEK